MFRRILFRSFVFMAFMLLLPWMAGAQTSDTLASHLDSLQVYYFSESRLDSSFSRKAVWQDTVFHGFQNFDPLLESADFSQTPGNIGLAHKNMQFTPDLGCGFDPGLNHFDGYRLNNDKVRYFETLMPFTELKYVSGSRKEQYFHVVHSHNIKKRLVIGANFRILNAPGRRSFRQKADDISTYFTAFFTSRNQRYGVFAHYYYNRLKCMENGGLLADSLYEQFREGRNLTQFEYGLDNALNTLKENAWFLKQTLNLDFRKPDSTAGKLRGFSLGILNVSTFYQKPRFIYTDRDAGSGYYPITYTDSTEVADSMFYKRLENSIQWCSNEFSAHGLPSPLRFFAGLRHSYIEIHEEPQNTYLSQFLASAGFSVNVMEKLRVEASGQYIYGGYNDKDFALKALVGYSFGKHKKGGILSLSGNYSALQASWVSRHFYSNYFRWDYTFLKQEIISATLNYRYPRLDVSFVWNNLYRPIYWDQMARPRQYSGKPINILGLVAKKDLVFGKFRVDSKLLLQYSDNGNIIRVPWLVASQSYYVSFKMFKKALGVETGVEAWYNTPYYADAWMPATRQFYLQDQRKVGNYVYIDVFLNLQIKRAFLFLALDHANSGLWGYQYYTTPHYPAADRSFRFGVRWLFHD